MRVRIALPVAFAATALIIAGCSSSSDDNGGESPEPTATVTETEKPTASPTSTGGSTTSALCSEEAILNALPESSEMVSYTCADVAGTEWAAAKVNPGPTVFFLQANGNTWDVSTSDEVCGTASAGLPPSLLDYCD